LLVPDDPVPARLGLLPLGASEGGAWALPILHGRLECAQAVRDAVDALAPDRICIELPPTLEEAFLQGIARLPELSVVASPSAEAEGAPRYLLVEPTEPLVEAARLAIERGIALHLVDLDTEHSPASAEPWPDPFAATRLGWGRYVAQLLPSLPPSEEPGEQRREEAMAHHVQALLVAGAHRLLLVCGMAHVPGLLLAMQAPRAFPFGPQTRPGVRLLNLHPDSCREVLSEMPFLQRAWERRRNPEPSGDWPQIGQGGEAATGVIRFPGLEPDSLPAARRSAEEAPRRPTIAPVRDSPVDRLKVHLDLCRSANDRVEEEEQSRVPAGAIEALLQYARNLALLEDRLVPGVFDLLLAARGISDDNFAWWFWQEATDWPWQSDRAEIGTVRLTLEDLDRGSRVFHFHRRERVEGLLRHALRPRPREARPGEWKEAAGPHQCSYPPEDVAIEGYAAFLRKRTTGILSAEQTRTEPFSTSILDGIDLRETIRNMAHDGRLYVRENRPVKGKVGSVIIIFDEDQEDRLYPFRMTWQGEHDEESDMAFYSTPPGEKMVGPGISRCEYGGLFMTWPPHRLFGLWEDEVFEGFPRKHERLCLGGILYSLERIVTYIADKPPRPLLGAIAAHFGRKLAYIPLGQLSPVTLKRIRTFHVLHGRWVRSVAAEYIR
jgi:hypothetical protein